MDNQLGKQFQHLLSKKFLLPREKFNHLLRKKCHLTRKKFHYQTVKIHRHLQNKM